MKIKNDKYYTSKELAKYCIDKTYEIIGKENISLIMEPSAGNGAFSTQLDSNITYALDIDPEHKDIIQQDFLEAQFDYVKGRLVIGNPPFGSRMNLAQKFYKKAVMLSDYIAFILPVSQLNQNRTLFEFDLIYSEDLGKQLYTDRLLHCCFNIYKRPNSGELNKRIKDKLEDIHIIRQDSRTYQEAPYDVRMCCWGDGTCGKILKEGESYSAEYKIQLLNDKNKEEIKQFIIGFDWNKYTNMNIAMKRLKQYHIIEVLKQHIKNIK